MLRALFRYRHFVASAIAAEFRTRFARSRLGLLWAVLLPLAQALIFAIVLSEVLGAKLPGADSMAAYPLYLLSGIAAWTLFSELLSRCTTVFLEYAPALKKISFPRLCLPVIVWGTALINHALLLAAVLVIAIFLGYVPGPEILAVGLGVLMISCLAFGLGIFLGVLNVFSRDVGQTMGIVLQLWFWLTPIVYPYSIVPERFRILVDLNPMTSLVSIYQDAILFGAWPSPAPLVVPAVIAFLALAVSFAVFRRAGPDLVDAL